MQRLVLVFLGCAAAVMQPAFADDGSALAAIRAACAADAQKFCAGVPSGGGRIIACLKQHRDSLSQQCRQAAAQAANPGGGSGAGAAAVAPASGDNPAPAMSAPAASAAPAAGAAASTPKPAHSPAPGAAHAADAPGSYLRMKQAQVIAKVVDPALGPGTVSLPALDMLIPSTWELKGNVNGNTTEGCFSDFFAMSWEALSPDGSIAFQGAPNDSWQYADDPATLHRLNDPNRRQLGLHGKPCPVRKPMKAEEYFRQNILSALPAGSNVVSVEPFPELNEIARKQLGLPPNEGGSGGGTRTEAVRARVEFQKDGKPLEGWATVVVVTRAFPQGRGAFYDCHAIDVMALRAPKGKLDANDKLFKVMISSLRTEPRWQSYSGNFIAKLYQAEAQKEATIDGIIANFQRQVAATIMGVVANQQQGSYNSAFAADQNIRGVQTFRDPTSGKTMELSNLYDHAWLNGSNEYVMSDDPNFNPNRQLSGNWSQLQAVRPAP